MIMRVSDLILVPHRVSKSTNSECLFQVRELPPLCPYPPAVVCVCVCKCERVYSVCVCVSVFVCV